MKAKLIAVALITSAAFHPPARANEAKCRELAPLANEVSVTSGRLAETFGSLSFDYTIQQLPIGSPEREAMSKWRDRSNEAIVALKELRKASRDAAYALDVCGNGG